MPRTISPTELDRVLRKLDGRGYGSYKDLYDVTVSSKEYTLKLTSIQGDTHAPPSILEAKLPIETHKLEDLDIESTLVYKPLSDYASRLLHRITGKYSERCGNGNSCLISVPKPSPRMLYRSTVVFDKANMVLRLWVGLPSIGRRVNGRMARRVLLERVPRVIRGLVEMLGQRDPLKNHIHYYILQTEVRRWLVENGYSFIIGNGSILPREAGFSQKPLEDAIPFQSPPELEREICVEHGCIRGMLVEDGVTLLTGGAYHGKTTLLQAILEGIYNHIPGDGREHVISRPDTFLVQSEDGRIITCTDISLFFNTLPDGRDTVCFNTIDASGSTSMAAAISESLELGVRHILFDEDTSATNLLYKDNIMMKLMPEDPIKPLNLTVRKLYEHHNVSFTAITTASSSFLPQATHLIKMVKYDPQVITKPITPEHIGREEDSSCDHIGLPKTRVFLGVKSVRKIKSMKKKILIDYERTGLLEFPVDKNPRIVEDGQVKFIARSIRLILKTGLNKSFHDIALWVDSALESGGFRFYVKPVPPDLVETSGLDVIWVLDRVYNLKVRHEGL
ncbi:MAG: ABC-ATPase domain-containing protein [Desulfurococcales archaeon]|nr:ABC-ATPase domain-containing protein [Desulfurococcales archaeon]